MHAEFGAGLEVPESATKIDEGRRTQATSRQKFSFNDEV